MQEWPEQAPLMKLARDPYIRNRFKLLPQNRFNSYLDYDLGDDDGKLGGDNEPEPFVLHFAGVDGEWKEGYMVHYLMKVGSWGSSSSRPFDHRPQEEEEWVEIEEPDSY